MIVGLLLVMFIFVVASSLFWYKIGYEHGYQEVLLDLDSELENLKKFVEFE